MAEKQKEPEDRQQRNRDEVLEAVFAKYYTPDATEVLFSMDDIRETVKEVSRKNPGYRENNIADIRYQYTSGRRALPPRISALGHWMIAGRGKARYAFVLLKSSPQIEIQADLAPVLLPDATPEIVREYAGVDEQGLLAKAHYNRLVDTFLQITCYHLQNHWRTSVKNKGQCEIDDLYVGVDLDGRQFVVPIEAKCAGERISKVQVAQMIDFARERYPKLTIRPVGIQEMKDKSLVLLEFPPANNPDEIAIRHMRRYRLVEMKEIAKG